jgi:hypothetical protein
MSNCSNENMVTLLIAIWKTFCVLLEFSCKTEYKLLITKISAKCEDEKVEIIEKYKILLEKEAEEKNLLRQN